MKYIYSPTKEYPISKDDVFSRLQKKNYLLSKNISEDVLETLGFYLVHDNNDSFDVDIDEKIIESNPVKNEEGKWIRQYKKLKLNSEEMKEKYKNKINKINKLYSDKLELGYPFTIDNKVEHIQLRKDDISQLSNILVYLKTMDDDYVGFIRTRENVNRFYPKMDLIKLINEALIYSIKIYNSYRVIKDDFLSCSDKDKINYKVPNLLEVK